MRVICNHLALCDQKTAWRFPSAFDEGLTLSIYIAYTVYNIPLIRKWLSARSVFHHSGEVVSEEKHSIVTNSLEVLMEHPIIENSYYVERWIKQLTLKIRGLKLFLNKKNLT